MPKKNTTIFEEHILEKVSVNYRFMHKDNTNSIREFYTGVRFSNCDKHRSEEYINYSCYKPVSSLYIYKFFEKNERK